MNTSPESADAARPSPYAQARTQPRYLLAGLYAGVFSVVLTFGIFVPFAPLFPLALCGATFFFERHDRVAAFSVGAFTAFVGVTVFVVTLLVLFVVLASTGLGARP